MNPPTGDVQAVAMDEYRYQWRSDFSNTDMNVLHAEAFDHRVLDIDWRKQVERHSLGWVCAFGHDGSLVGFVNVPWDGDVHAFIMDTAVAVHARRHGIGRQLVAVAVEHARAAGCEWLHVDFDEEYLERFYFDTCGFAPTTAGLIRLV